MEENKLNTFEKLADGAYRRFAPIAKSYYYSFRRPSVTRGGVPSMVFLGNHSSGKSSLINWVLGGEPVQESGLAPTDDGFTILLYGDTNEDICGPAALTRLPEEFHALEAFGGSFLQHLKVKIRSRELLKTVTLIDTPGMIDSAEGTVSRTYDFEGVVRLLAEVCDMVFFLFDPDKPGTTGETVSVFSKCLAGVEFKLRVLLNKCDAFSSLYDFARTYGTVCWNLARVLHTKDLPKIWTVYSGSEKPSTNFDFSDFNKHREEFIAVLHDAAARRMDNVYSQALTDFLGLSVRMRVVNHAARTLATLRTTMFFGAAVIAAISAYLVRYWILTTDVTKTLLANIAAGVCALLILLAAHFVTQFTIRLARIIISRKADEIFAHVYRRELAIGTHENMRQHWADTRNDTIDLIRDAPLKLPLFGEFARHRLDKAAEKVFRARTS